jgi:Asp-tRNA(Asn)/Glu-tRNA(Gln) amidotransferase B subunit
MRAARKKEEAFKPDIGRSDKDLDEIVEQVISKSPSILLDIQAGRREAIDRVVIEVMRMSNVKTDPAKIKNIVLSKL